MFAAGNPFPGIFHITDEMGVSFTLVEGKEVYYRAADNRQADALHHMIEEIAELSCPR